MRRLHVAILVAGMLFAAHAAAQEDAAPRVFEVKPDAGLADCGIQAAIDEAAAAGGGSGQIPQGTFELRRGLILRDGVRLRGAGMDKTILMPRRHIRRLDVTRKSPVDGKVFLTAIPDDLKVGSAVVMCDRFPPAWYGSPRPGYVTAIDAEAKTITVAAPYGFNNMEPGKGYLVFGDAAALEKSIAKGDAEIHLKDASMFQPGDELAIGEPPNESLNAHAFVKEVRGNILVLEEPVAIDFDAWPDAKKIGNKKVNALVWTLFPMVHALKIKDAAIEDLTIQARKYDNVMTTQTRYTLSGIHLSHATNTTIEQVAVRDWPADGFSLQTGADLIVRNCEATGIAGNGMHPGTSITNILFDGNLCEGNGSGLYFCWHNRGHTLRKNRFINNRGGGITGLGNPGDRNNIIEDNLIADNGGAGIEINGGMVSGNVIRNNVIRDNSREKAGKHPGILLHAATEDAKNYTVEGNTFESTIEEPTQWVGVEERNGKYQDKPRMADENVIRNNTFKGMKTADVIQVGPATKVEGDGVNVVKAPAEVAGG